MPPAVFALSLAAFCIGTTEFIISGTLLHVSSDLHVTVPTAGLLVSGYAVGVAIGGPLLGLLLNKLPLKPAILGVIALFALGQLLCAIAPTYKLLLLARLVSACGHGLFFGVATIAVSAIVPAERKGAALSLMVGGITISNILGLPVGTAIGNAFGWRVTFLCIAAASVLAVVAVWLTLPNRSSNEAEADAPLNLQLRQLGHQDVWTSYLIVAIIMVGQVAFGTFQVATLTSVTGIDLDRQVPFYLLGGGAGAIVGIWLGGKGADWRIGPSVLAVLIGQIACFALLLPGVHNAVAMAVLLFLSAMFGFGFSTPLQVRILNGARAAPRLAATLVSSAYNVGIAAGAWCGASLLEAGLGYALLPLAGLAASTVALLVAALSLALARSQRKPMPA